MILKLLKCALMKEGFLQKKYLPCMTNCIIRLICEGRKFPRKTYDHKNMLQFLLIAFASILFLFYV